jgi:hypothetical protein
MMMMMMMTTTSFIATIITTNTSCFLHVHHVPSSIIMHFLVVTVQDIFSSPSFLQYRRTISTI